MKSFVVGIDLTIRVFVSAGANSVLFIPCKGLDLVQISADWVVLLTEMTQAKSETCEELEANGQSKGASQENLWPKSFSRAPRCAPLRLPWKIAHPLVLHGKFSNLE